MNNWTEVQVEAYAAIVNAKQQYEEKRTGGGVGPTTIIMHPETAAAILGDLHTSLINLGHKEVLIGRLIMVESADCQPGEIRVE